MILKRVNELEKLTALIPALAKQNSQKAWNEFVQMTSNDLHRYICYFLHDADHASDILQEVYILFLRDKEILNKICLQETQEIAAKKIYAWLYKTARNKSLDLIKKKKNGIAAQLYLSQKSPSRELNMPTQNLEKKETNELIKYELSLLNEKQQDLLTLKFFHEKSNLEIASEINCEVISVPKLIDRALAQLKKRLEKVGVIISMVMIGESLSNKAMCVDMPANLLPEVFQLYKTVPVDGLLTNSITLKGILMKSLYTIVGATVISTFVFYINAPTQEQKKAENPKKATLIKETANLQKKETLDPIKPVKVKSTLPIASHVTNDIPVTSIRSYHLENPVVKFKINSISQLMSDYKESPYFQFANSNATGSDFDRIDFSKIYDMYNDGILDLALDSMDFKVLFSTIKVAKSLEYQSDLKTSFVLKFDFDSIEEAKLKHENLAVGIKKRIKELKQNYSDLAEETKKDTERNNEGKIYNVKITGSYEKLFHTKVELIGKAIYIINDAKEIISKEKLNYSNHNITLQLKLNETLLKNPIVKALSEIFNADTSLPIQVNYEFNSSGLLENIVFQISDADKVFFNKTTLTNPIKELMISQNSNNQIFTNIKPNYIYPLLKIVGPYIEETFEQKLMVANLLCFQKYQKSIESLIKESLNGDLFVNTSIKNTQILFGLTKENKIKSILENLANDLELPFQWQIIENQYLKLSMDSFLNFQETANNQSDHLIQDDLFFLGKFNTKMIFQDSIQERLLLAQKYSAADSNIKDCIPLLSNEQIYPLFNELSTNLFVANQRANLKINSPIPYLFGYLFFEHFENNPYQITINQDSNSDKSQSSTLKGEGKESDLTNESISTTETYATDKTIFQKTSSSKSEIIENLYYGEKGQVECSYKRNLENKNVLVNRYNAENKLIETYTEMENKKNGEYKQFDKNGVLFQKGEYQIGFKTGEWLFYEGDDVLGQITYKDNLPTKSFERKFPAGGIEIKVELDSKGNGNGKNFFKNGGVKLEGDYVNFKRVNCWKVFYPDGNIQAEIYYNYFGEKQKIITFYKSQDKHFIIPYKGNLIDGKVLEYYPLGKSKGEYQITKGNPSPHWILYHEDGKISGEWLPNGSYTGILKKLDKEKPFMQFSLAFEGSKNTDNIVIINKIALEIESKLNILYSRATERIGSSINGPVVSSIPEFKPHLNLRGQTIAEINIYFGITSDQNQIKESILFLINSWNNQLIDFINNNSNNCYFLMNDQIIYKLFIENGKVKSTEYLEFSNELF